MEPGNGQMRRRESLAFLCAMLLGNPTAMHANADDTDMIEFKTTLPFDRAVARLVDAIQAAGMQLFATIDHAAAAASVDLSMPPTTVLVYGNPKVGTPLMLASPAAALDLPLRVLVRADADGRTFVAFHPIGKTLSRAGVPEALAKRLAPAQDMLVDALRN